MPRRNVRIEGAAISPGYGEGNAYIVKEYTPVAVKQKAIDESQIEDEYARIRKAFSLVVRDLSDSAEHVGTMIDESFADIFTAQITMLQDPSLLEESRRFLEKELISAEKTVTTVFSLFAERLKQTDNNLLQEKAEDLADLSKRVIHKLTDRKIKRFSHVPDGSILVTSRLLPSDAIGLPREYIRGIVLEVGGAASHAAILTREMGIPAVSEVANIGVLFNKSDTILVDGNEGIVTINPEEDAKKRYQEKKRQYSNKRKQASLRAREPALTVDGKKVPVQANIGDRNDAIFAAENGADGIGLYRTEQLYLSLDQLPDSTYLEREISDVLQPVAHLPVNIRLLDTGNDKQIPFLSYPEEDNPALGLRGIRFLLKYPELLKQQLVAILNLSKTFNVNILVPMVTSVNDIRELKQVLRQCADSASIKKSPPVGAMIETPAAALLAGTIAAEVDFLSIGTNDLTQYTMASGRENHLVAEYYKAAHPAVMKLISLTIDAVENKTIALCGELASHPDSIPQLLKAGIATLSVNPLQIPAVKEVVREVNLSGQQ